MTYINGEGKEEFVVFFKLVNKVLNWLVGSFFQGAAPYPEEA